MMFVIGDKVRIIQGAKDDIGPWLGMIGQITGTCEGWEFPYDVSFPNGDESEFSEDELEAVEDEI